MMIDADEAYVSPTAVYRILSDADPLCVTPTPPHLATPAVARLSRLYQLCHRYTRCDSSRYSLIPQSTGVSAGWATGSAHTPHHHRLRRWVVNSHSMARSRFHNLWKTPAEPKAAKRARTTVRGETPRGTKGVGLAMAQEKENE